MRLIDLGFIGPKFTWSNMKQGWSYIKEKLDKVVGNIEWRRKFTEAIFCILTAGGSDHFSILFVPNSNNIKLFRPFRFHDMSFRDKECENIIKNGWVKLHNSDRDNMIRTLKNTLKGGIGPI